ncbi:replication factor C subunit 1-like [Uranotaenia lowii]|uniref:replication factor C subunit 1-like n=1 Tax=Uranotaenia lowii TaxID=190385 RepID=UPI002479AA47|nr:replication factor C subunit 1-like [Uranotaenia lowii]
MSKDIRSFFTSGPKVKKPEIPKESVKRKAIIDSDDESQETRHQKPSAPVSAEKSHHTKKRRVIDDSDEEKSPVKAKSSSGSKKPDLSKLKPVSAADVFGSAPVKRVEIPKPSKKAVREEIEIHSDEEFEKTLRGLDESDIIPETPPVKKEKESSSKEKKRDDDRKVKESPSNKGSSKDSPSKSSKHDEKKSKDSSSKEKKDRDDPKTNGHGYGDSKKKVPTPEKQKLDPSPEKHKEKSSSSSEKLKKIPPSPSPQPKPKEKPIKKESVSSEDSSTPRSKKNDLNESVLTDEERFERKRASAALYKKFMARAGPANPGSKEIPEGKPNCLAGLQFIVTGVLESMERDECAQVIKDLGGKVVSSVSKKLTHMVVGDDAGPEVIGQRHEGEDVDIDNTGNVS